MNAILDLDDLAPAKQPVQFTDCEGQVHKFDVGTVSLNVGLRIIQNSGHFAPESLEPLVKLVGQSTPPNSEQAKKLREVMHSMLDIIVNMLNDQGDPISFKTLERSLSFPQMVKLISVASVPIMSYLSASKGLVG